jgi:acetate kinase
MSGGAASASGGIRTPSILTLNAGSSSVKFALFELSEALRRMAHGAVERIGISGTQLTFSSADAGSGADSAGSSVPVSNAASPIAFLLEWLERQFDFRSLIGVGHRLVHGMQHTEPEAVSDQLLQELLRIRPYDPEHLPRELELVQALRQRYPRLPQILCFDTSFHRTMPAVAKLLPIARRYQSPDVQRYGFHGLSCAYLIEELTRLGDPAAASGRLILAHLGNGASMTAVQAGRSIETSMGFTPTSGLPMGTRSGDLDPGLMSFLMRSAHLSVAQFEQLANHESGLLGVSEISSDVRELLERERSDARAAEALGLFCYQARKWIGALAAALGGLDALVFAGGIGENAAVIRERICSGLGFLGIELDAERNRSNSAVISRQAAAVRVRVIKTDEELMIARTVQRALAR